MVWKVIVISMELNEIGKFLGMVKQEIIENTNAHESFEKSSTNNQAYMNDVMCENTSENDGTMQLVEVQLKQECIELEKQVTIPESLTSSKMPFACTNCGLKFASKILLTRHMQDHENEFPYSCTIFNVQTDKLGVIEQHKLTHSGGEISHFTCSFCNFTCIDKNDFNTHILNHPKYNIYSCKSCDYTSKIKDLYESHTCVHSIEIEKPYTCSKCDYKSSQRIDLKRHMYTHTDEKPYHCKICDYKSTNNAHLKEHMVIHTGDKPYSCSVCEFKCAWPKGLKRHMLKHKGEMPYACTECDYKTVDNGNLKSHMLVHLSHNEKPFACTECDYKCVYKSLLTQHMLIHTGEKSFLCEYCPYKSARKRDMNTHTKIHTGEKPFACSDCDYRSSDRGNLRRHRLTHTGEKPFACTICTYTCSLRWLLRKHILTHSNESTVRKSLQSSKSKTQSLNSSESIANSTNIRECIKSHYKDSASNSIKSSDTSSQPVSVSHNTDSQSVSHHHLHFPDPSVQSNQIYTQLHHNYIHDSSQIPYPLTSYASNPSLNYNRLVNEYIRK